MANELLTAILSYMPVLKLLGLLILALAILGAGFYYILVIRRRRKWKIEVHEQKTDGKLHSVGYDTLIEKKLKWGTMTIYWLKRAKQECIPPPNDVVDRMRNGKEEVDYLRFERDMIPAIRNVKVNYNNPAIRAKITPMYDRILSDIRNTKTSYKDHSKITERWIHIPINRTINANVIYEPIPYDMNMMAMNEIRNADEFFASKYEFWKKYGAVIVFGLTIIFLIIVVVLTYDYLTDVVAQMMDKISNTASLLEKVTGTTKPPN